MHEQGSNQPSNARVALPAFPSSSGEVTSVSLWYLSRLLLTANANSGTASWSSLVLLFFIIIINKQQQQHDRPKPNLAQAASQPPVSTVYSSQLCAVMGACIVSSSRIVGRWQGSLHPFCVELSHWPSHTRPTEQSSHRLVREACCTGFP